MVPKREGGWVGDATRSVAWRHVADVRPMKMWRASATRCVMSSYARWRVRGMDLIERAVGVLVARGTSSRSEEVRAAAVVDAAPKQASTFSLLYFLYSINAAETKSPKKPARGRGGRSRRVAENYNESALCGRTYCKVITRK